jgi:hypothetical protein
LTHFFLVLYTPPPFYLFTFLSIPFPVFLFPLFLFLFWLAQLCVMGLKE